MGQDKARLAWRGQPLLLRGLSQLAVVCEELLLASGRAGRYQDLFPGAPGAPLPGNFAGRALREVPDRLGAGQETPLGPLAGLEAALEAAQGEWVWVTSCDLPLLDPELGPALLAQAESEGADVALCALPAAPGQVALPEPLCGVYRAELGPACRRALEAGERRVLAFLKQDLCPGAGPARRPRLTLLPLLGERAWSVFNLNTPEDLRALESAPLGRELSA
jgi:molybdopterin-guanine dinucleotide biosynthesis protein A